MTGAPAVWTICIAALAGVIVRPFRWPEAVWAAAGAVSLVALGLLPIGAALGAVAKGGDVYLFLVGMMLLAEAARAEGLFDWLAAAAVARAKGSPRRLLALVYAAGVVTTAFLSNDATAVVLTPAVYAAARKAGAQPFPLLIACALVANAASFVLPISNPANLVLYGGRLPALGRWLASFAFPSLASVAVTFAALRFAVRRSLKGACAVEAAAAKLALGGWVALGGIAVTAAALVVASALGRPLGLPTCSAGLATTLGVGLAARRSPLAAARKVAWSIVPLVAGLFVLVESLARTGAAAALARGLAAAARHGAPLAAALAGASLAFGANLVNNLTAGLMAATAVGQARPPALVVDGLLIGVDLGPNLSITGSLATILWLAAVRRDGERVGFWDFLKVGAIVMPLGLLAGLGARIAIG